MTGNPGPGVQKRRYSLRLFVAGNAANSRIARENLERFQASHSEHEFVIQVVDMNLNVEIALEQGVFISPALQILIPAPGGIIYGNLSDSRVLEQALDL